MVEASSFDSQRNQLNCLDAAELQMNGSEPWIESENRGSALFKAVNLLQNQRISCILYTILTGHHPRKSLTLPNTFLTNAHLPSMGTFPNRFNRKIVTTDHMVAIILRSGHTGVVGKYPQPRA